MGLRQPAPLRYAVDLGVCSDDTLDNIKQFCVDNRDNIKALGLYVAHFYWTPNYVHFDFR